jgi:hypothetical protein|tara:strand:- start:149 stop:1015 length:867 start_codon:yes stop_codon:yes gene_type:complete
MAINISYDPSNDPEAIAALEAEEADSLEVGEKLVQEQEELLAGKYKNAEELEKAYMELQSKFGSGEEEEEAEEYEEGDEPVEGDAERYDEEGYVNFESVADAYGDQLADAFQENGIDPWAMNDHFYENDGTLTPEMYDELNEAGFSDETIDAYLGGLRNQLGYDDAGETLNDSEIADIKNIAGGEQGYADVVQWASENLPAEDIEAFDEVINTANEAAVRFAVKALVGQYEDAVGRTPDLVTGKQSSTGQAYRSMAEVVRDMSDPRYDTDDAYRIDVMRKLERSNLKV